MRERRRERGEKLTETAARAGISPQYLSELERGLKDASSEVLAAVAGALEITLVDLTVQIASELIRQSAVEPALAPVRSIGSSIARASGAGSYSRSIPDGGHPGSAGAVCLAA